MSAPNFSILTPLLAEPLRGTTGPRYLIGDAVLTGVVANADDTVGMGVIAGTVPVDAPEFIGCYSMRHLREAVSLAEKIGMRRFVLAAYGDEVPEQALLLMIDTRGDRFVAVASRSLAANYPAQRMMEVSE